MKNNNGISFPAKNLFCGMFKYVLIIAAAVILALVSLFGFSYVSHWVSGYKEYIFYLIPGSSMTVAIGIAYFWFFILFYRISYKIHMKKFDAEEMENTDSPFYESINEENNNLIDKLLRFYDNSSVKRKLKIIAIVLSIGGFFYSFTTFNIIKEDKIIVHNPFNLKGKIYSYNDIFEINTGISDNKDSNLYYKIKLKDGKIINVTAASMDTKEQKYEVAIYNMDQKLVKNGVKKNIDMKNINKFYNKNYDKKYVENVEKILK